MSEQELKVLFSTRLNALLRKNGENQKEFAKAIGVPTSTVNDWVKGARLPRMGKVEKVAQHFGVERSFFMTPEFSPIPRGKQIPILGTVHAGLPAMEYEDVQGYVEYAGKDTSEYFCLYADGDSMTQAGIGDGDLIVVEKTPIVENGQIAVVSIDDCTTVKEWHLNGSVLMLLPRSYNPAHQPQIYDLSRQNVLVLGVVVESRHSFK